MLASLLLLLAVTTYADEVLDNAAVIRLAQAGLGADIVALKVEQSPAHFDVSTDGLIALKAAGVPDVVIRAMLMKTSTPKATTSDGARCANVKYYTLGNNGWNWVPASLCTAASGVSVDEQSIPLDRIAAHCFAKASLFALGDTTYRNEEQEWWFTDGKDVYKFRGKQDETKAIADFIVQKHPSSKHGS